MSSSQKSPGSILRFTLAEIMVLIAVVALVCRWPLLLILALPAGAWHVGGKLDRAESRGAAGIFYRLLLPAVWLPTAWISWQHPGDEYGLFIVSGLPAGWIMPFLSYGHLREALLPLFAAGALTMALGGWAMDRLRVWRTLWLPLFLLGVIALVIWTLAQYPSYQRAMAKNGSLTAYVSAAANMSLYLSASASLLLTLIARVAFALRTRSPLVPAELA